MSDYANKQSSAGRAPGPATAASSSPGKRTLVERTYGDAPTVQLQGSKRDDASVHEVAARGTATPATPLPHGDRIERAFGRHDVSAIRAHVGQSAAASASEMGAMAYATGNHVVLGQGADLFTEAHEAAHVVQQRGGVQLRGAVGEQGDRHEQHADEVAALVIQGRSAEHLLDQVAGSASTPDADGGQPRIQRQIANGADAAQQPSAAAPADAAFSQPAMGDAPSDFGDDIETTPVEARSTSGVIELWQQTWVTNRGAIMVIYGTFKGGALTLEGETHLRDGSTIHQRITWKAEGKGVRESAVMSKDGGKTWKPAFDVLFVKHASS